MGIGGISIWQLLIILAIVFMLFGTKKLRNLGGDLGSAIKGFKNAMKEEPKLENQSEKNSDETIEGSVSNKQEQAEHKNT